MHILAGSISGESSPYILFCNILWASFLSFLYSHFDGINWYPLSFIIGHICFLSVFLWFIFKKINHKTQLYLWLLFVLGIESLLLIHLQFTSTATLLGFSALMLFTESALQKRFSLALFASVLLIMCILIRVEAAIAVAIIGSLFFLIKVPIRQSIPIVVFSLCLLGLEQIIQRDAYQPFYDIAMQTPKNQATILFLQDYPITIKDPDLSKINWTKNDYLVFKHWFWADRQFHTPSNFGQLASIAHLDLNIYNKIKHSGSFLYHYMGFVLGVFFFILTQFRSFKKKKLWLIAIPILLIFIYLIVVERMFPRVVFPLVFGALLLSLFENEANSEVMLWRPKLLISLVFIAFLSQFIIFQKINIENKIAFEKEFAAINRYPSSLIVNKGSCLNIEGCPIWQLPKTYSKQNFTFVDFMVGLPTFESVMAQRGIKNLMSSLWERNDILIVADDVNDICTFAKEHYNTDVHAAYIEKDISPGIHLFKIIKN